MIYCSQLAEVLLIFWKLRKGLRKFARRTHYPAMGVFCWERQFPWTMSVPTHFGWVWQECMALAAFYLHHFSGQWAILRWGNISPQTKSRCSSACYENVESLRLSVIQAHSVQSMGLIPSIDFSCLHGTWRPQETNANQPHTHASWCVESNKGFRLWPTSFVSFVCVHETFTDWFTDFFLTFL